MKKKEKKRSRFSFHFPSQSMLYCGTGIAFWSGVSWASTQKTKKERRKDEKTAVLN